jgi:hypothetical protein
MQKIIFHLPLKISANAIYAGIHWTKRNKHKQLFQAVPFVAKPITKYPVICHYHFVLSGRLLDITNLFYMTKLQEDSLVNKGILRNDTPQFVSEIRTTIESGKEDVCYITISEKVS